MANTNASVKKKNTRNTVLRVLLYVVIIAICLITLYPYFVTVCTALKSRAEIFSMNGTIFPVEAIWSNFTDVWKLAPMSNYMMNSIVIAGGSTLLAMVCGIPAAYALSRMKFKGQTAFLGFVIVSQMFAPVVLLIGIYKVMMAFHLTNSIIGLIFINAAFNQAFAIWLLRGTFLSISPEMEQAATIDGCNRVHALLRILLPVAAPGIVTAFRIYQRLERIYSGTDTDLHRYLQASHCWYQYFQRLQYDQVAVSVCCFPLCNRSCCNSVRRNRKKSGWRTHFWWCQGLIFIFFQV